MIPTDIQREARELWEAAFDAYCNGCGDKSAHERAEAICAAHIQRIQQEGAKRWALKIVQKMHDDYCMNAESGMTDPETGERTFDQYESSRIETIEEVMEALRSARPDERKET